ncbi:MAG: hypothetical protein IMZ60_01960 [Actinobacteria bacterium]|nr:hypothetical protein [Actinomycetota bacterium]
MDKNSFNILIYGADRLGYPEWEELNIGNGIKLYFCAMDEVVKFQDYDGVVIFQGIWDQSQRDLLDKRIKEVFHLYKKNSFICFLADKNVEERAFDLANQIFRKMLPGISCTDVGKFYNLKIYRDELKAYMDEYGIPNLMFNIYSDKGYEVIISKLDTKEVAGFCFNGKIFYLPCHIVHRDEESMKRLFTLLCNGLVSLYKKYQWTIPEWANDYKFIKEIKLINNKKEREKELSEINKKINVFMNYKRVLILSDNQLKEAVADMLERGFRFRVDRKEEFIEDLKISYYNKEEKKYYKALVEVKGVNRNVDRQSINELDSHRDRRNLKSNFPGILIANTFIKSSNSIKNKDKPISNDQIEHARRNNILILRTIDLIRALNIIINDDQKYPFLVKKLFTEKGWLEVKDDKFIFHS